MMTDVNCEKGDIMNGLKTVLAQIEGAVARRSKVSYTSVKWSSFS